MRRVVVTLATAAVLSGAVFTAGGCGSQTYEKRLAQTLENMKYQKRLNDNLQPPPKKNEGKLEAESIYVRPPKNMVWSKEFLLTVVEPGKFDVAETFHEQAKSQSLHVLARIKKPTPAKKKTPEPTNRGEFTDDVLAILNNVYGTTLDKAKLKEIDQKGNKFRELTPFKANDRNVRIDFYGGKNDTYQVALIFEYPETEQQALVSKIELCLQSFAVGRRAQRTYAGTTGEEEEGGAGAGAGAVNAF